MNPVMPSEHPQSRSRSAAVREGHAASWNVVSLNKPGSKLWWVTWRAPVHHGLLRAALPVAS